MPEANINLLPSAIALGVKGVIKPKNLGAPHVPKDVLEKAGKRFKDYQAIIKKDKHASLGNKIKRKWQGDAFDIDENPKEKERLNNLRLAILDIYVYLTDAIEYFQGCTGVEMLEKYLEQVEKDYADLIKKGYLPSFLHLRTIDDARYDLLRKKNEADRSARSIAKRFPKEKYNVIGENNTTLIPANMRNQIKPTDNYITRVKAIYTIAYEWFKNMLNRKFQQVIKIGDRDLTSQFILQYIALHYLDNSPISNTLAKKFLNQINDSVNDFAAEHEKLEALGKEIFKSYRKELGRKFQNVEKKSLEIKDLLYDIQSSSNLYYVGLSTSDASEGDAKDKLQGIYDSALGIPQLMNGYIKYTHGNNDHTTIIEAFSKLFTSLNTLQKAIDGLANSEDQINSILNLKQDTKTYLKNIDKMETNIKKATKLTDKIKDKLDSIDTAIINLKQHKSDTRKQWVMFGISLALGATEKAMNSLSEILIATPKSPGVGKLT